MLLIKTDSFGQAYEMLFYKISTHGIYENVNDVYGESNAVQDRLMSLESSNSDYENH